MNHPALLAHNAQTAQQTATTALLQELVRDIEERDKTIARLEELVKTQAKELEALRPKPEPAPAAEPVDALGHPEEAP